MANDRPPPNYYAVLNVSETATTQQVRDAYKRAALKNHPDRVPMDSPDRAARTRKFQLVNDAYFTLSDTERRREYDVQRKLHQRRRGPTAHAGEDEEEGDETAGGGGGGGAASWAWNYFQKATGGGGGAGAGAGGADNEQARRQADDAQFADAFEEMLREEGMAEPTTGHPTGKFWSVLGGLSGGALGFIVANVPGMVAGAVAGNRLGAGRDAKGKSVYAVFQELPPDDRSRLLSQLAARVFSHAVGI
ncbi:Heat shock protein DnaJ [Niveomyces insectorum RCEF 264]|uniref:Heat shock protein DnaJ n=1 Tax=Niveomyces insectorum RCEF 264 TaxID=1081102 RepID=A0A167UWH5_9HYPO|nr:Heat shock protein DnaJ [Niveomyces insectorum RCEF 264]